MDQTPLEKSQKPGVRLTHRSGLQRLRRTTLKGGEEQPPSERVAAPPGQHSATPRGSRWVCGFSSGKKSPSWTSVSPSDAGHFLGSPLGFHLTGSTGEICRTQPLGDTRDREGGWGSQQPVLGSWWTTFLLRVVSEQRSRSVALSVCRGRLVALCGQGAPLATRPDLGLQPMSKLGVEPMLQAYAGGEARSQSCRTAEHSLESCLTRKPRWQLWKHPPALVCSRAQPRALPNCWHNLWPCPGGEPSHWPCPVAEHSLQPHLLREPG